MSNNGDTGKTKPFVYAGASVEDIIASEAPTSPMLPQDITEPASPSPRFDPPRKRSGITLDRALTIQHKMQVRVADIYEAAIVMYMTSEQISERVREVFADKTYDKAPTWVISYVQGYSAARKDAIYRYHLVWVMWLDGRLCTRGEVDQATEEELEAGEDRSPHYRSPWQRIESDKSRHVWKDKNDQPLYDMPYDGKWRNE
jgi:hypothetical protein